MWLYRCLISVFAVFAVLRALRSDGVKAAAARLALASPSQDAAHVWVHAASNGELASVRPVLEALAQARPDLHWLVTTNTATGCDLAKGWGLPRSDIRLAPVDLSFVTGRMLRRWRVTAHIAVESEIWPHRVLSCPGPTLLLGARMSAGTARSWRRMGGLPGRVLARVALAVAQDADSAARLNQLGLPTTAQGLVLDLKALFVPPDLQPDATLRSCFPRAKTWLAASTHEGDDAGILTAHAIARAADPDLRLILAPRHPRRASDIATLAKTQGLSVALRSKGDPPNAADVYIADTLGEMPLWYVLAGRVFIAGTWTDRGGHTPYEPAAYGAALLHGGDTANFRAAFARLSAAQAALQVDSADALAQALGALAAFEAQTQAGAAAQAALRQEIDLEGLVTRCAAILPRQ